MAIYRYQSGSPLDNVQVLTNETGGKRAYLHAAAVASSEQLRKGKQAIRALGYKCVPIVHDGKPALEVRGFQTNEECIQALAKVGLTNDVSPTFTAEAGDEPTKKQKRANSTLKLAGLSYNVGDLAYMTYAYKQYKDELVPIQKVLAGDKTNLFNKINIYAGAGYALGSTALSLYGSKDQSLNTINTANQKIYAYLRKEGIDVPEGSTLKAATQEKDRGFFGNINHFLSKYPSETLNSIYVFVGFALMAVAGYRATRPTTGLVGEDLAKAVKERRAEYKDIGLGVMTASSAIAGLTIKEKKPIEGEPKRSGFGAVIDWVQEKPLRATGIGYFISTLFHAASTYDKYKEGDVQTRKTVFFRGVFVAANIFSELMLFLSSKGHGTGVKPDDSVDKSVIAATAELVMRQPIEKRESMIENMAGYMASRDVLGIKAELIAEELRTHIKALESSPWTKHYVQTKTGEMKEVEAAPQAPQTETHEKHGGTMASHDETPGNRISHAKYDAKHHTPEHALA